MNKSDNICQPYRADVPVHIEDVVFGSLLHALMRIARALCLCITARSGVLDVHVGTALSRTKPVHIHEPCSSLRERCVPHVGLRRSAANQLYMYTDAAPVLSASRRVTKTARSGVHDVHAGIVLALCCTANLEPNLCARTRTLLKLARAFTLRASR